VCPPTLRAWALAVAALTVLSGGCAVPQGRGSGRLQHIVEPTTRRGYWLYLPKDYVNSEESQRGARRWPLVVTFHGMKPFDNAHPQACEWQQEADRYGFIVVAPELRAFDVLGEFPLRGVNRLFKSDEEATLAILDHVLRTTRADPSNVLSTSWSSGGYMAHYMLNRHPDRFTCLAVRQSNFSASVLDPDRARRSQYHPILIINTQNDFAVCRRESRDAIHWYETHGYKNTFWVLIKDKGHERTPDLAAYFFGLVSGVQPSSAPQVLVQRQAIDGNEGGLAFLAGRLASFQAPPATRLAAGGPERDRAAAPSPRQVSPAPPVPGDQRLAGPPATARTSSGYVAASVPGDERVAGDGNERAAAGKPLAAVPVRNLRPNPVNIRVSSIIGLEPLALGFSAECPPAWQQSAKFFWTLDGEEIGQGVNGQKTLTGDGIHTLGLRVVTATGEEYHATRTVRVLPREVGVSAAAGENK